MSKDWVNDIYNMHKHYKFHEKIKHFDLEKMWELVKFRVKFMNEENRELNEAFENVDVEEIIDALIDTCVVAIGTLDLMGIDVHRAWDEVHKANMSKEVGIKPNRPNPLGMPDLIKPEGWKGPEHIDNHGRFQ